MYKSTANNLKYKNKIISIYGLGVTGMSCIKFFIEQGATLFIWDDEIQKCKKIYHKEIKNNIYIQNPWSSWKYSEIAIISPGIQIKNQKVQNILEICRIYGVEILSDIDILFNLRSHNSFIGITGTNGKSSTSSLIAHLMNSSGKDAFLCGNIGVPVLTSLTRSNEKTIFVIEISSFQLEILSSSTIFDISIILGISPDHQDRYSNFAEYASVKHKIIEHTKSFVIMNIDCKTNYELYKNIMQKNHHIEQKIIPFSCNKKVKNGISLIDGIIYDDFFDHITPLKNHQSIYTENILASYISVRCKGMQNFTRYYDTFKPLQHCMEIIYNKYGVTVVNDSKSTNSSSATRALSRFKNIHWIVGGISKEVGCEELSQHFDNLKYCYVVGRDKQKFTHLFSSVGIPFITCPNLLTAIKKASASCCFGDTILFSPACASLDDWTNYAERGRFFKRSIVRLMR